MRCVGLAIGFGFSCGTTMRAPLDTQRLATKNCWLLIGRAHSVPVGDR